MNAESGSNFGRTPPDRTVAVRAAERLSAPWEQVSASMLDELHQRLGSMRRAWRDAELARIEGMLQIIDESRTANARELLGRLRAVEGDGLAEEAELSHLIEDVENLIVTAGHACARDAGTAPPPRVSSRTRPDDFRGSPSRP